MLVLGIETSCDETATAVVEDGRIILSNVVRTQFDLHGRFGGVVPELASRRHIEVILPAVEEALNQAGVDLAGLDAIAVTQGPGLVGSLIVGLNLAKALSLVSGLPLAGVDHLQGHVMAGFLSAEEDVEFPLAALVVSGGHTNLYLTESVMDLKLMGQTRDDAAGEAFDKVAKLLNLGYPGGVAVDRLAKIGNPDRFHLPRPMKGRGLDFSFSGLKTAVLNLVNDRFQNKEIESADLADLAASFQAAVVDVLVDKTLNLVKQSGVRGLILAGGVAANSGLRQKMTEMAQRQGIRLILPPIELCTDNGAMIAAAGYHQHKAGRRLSLSDDAYSRVSAGV